MKKVLLIILAVILICVLGFGVVLLFKIDDPLGEPSEGDSIDSTTIVLTYDNVNLGPGANLSLDLKKENTFYLNQNKDYTVKIIPNINSDWTFIKDGEECSFSEVSDLTGAFNVECNDEYFIITMSEDFSMLRVLETVYPGSEIVLPGDFNYLFSHYTLEVSREGETPLRVNFRVFNASINGIILDKTEIGFLG